MIRPFQPIQGLNRALDTMLIFLMLWLSLRISGVALTSEYLILFIICTVIFGIFAEHHDIYHGWRGDPMFDVAMRILVSWAITFTVVVSCLFLFDFGFEYSKEMLELWLPLTPLSIIAPVSYTHLTLPTNREV